MSHVVEIIIKYHTQIFKISSDQFYSKLMKYSGLSSNYKVTVRYLIQYISE